MAGPYDFDPYAPVPENQLAPPAEPWSWVPPEWSSPQAYPQPPTQLQPGLGIPTSSVDAQAPAPGDEIEMPADYVGTPTLGFPHVPETPPAPIDAEPMFPPAADAISGPGPLVPTTAQPTPTELRSEALFEPKDPVDEVVPLAHQLTPDERGRQFAASSPEDQAKSEMAWVQQRDAEYGKRMSRLDLEDQQRSYENQQRILRARDDVRAQMVKLDTDSKALAEQNIDPEHWWSSRSTPQKIAGYVAAIVGGLVQSRQGGANQGMAMIDRAIDQDIDAQKENLANKRAELARRGASIQQRSALNQDDYLLGEQFRIATYSRLQNQVAKDMQNYDPAGKNALELGKIYTSIGQRRAQAMQDLEDKTFKQRVDAIKADLDTQKTAAEIAKLRAETMKMQGAGGPKALKPDEIPQDPSYYQTRGLEPPPVAMSPKDYAKWQPQKKATLEIQAGRTPSGLSKEQRENGVPGIKNTDGSEFIAYGRPEDVTKLRAVKQSTDEMVKLMDEALRIRSGWTSDTGNSEERQKLKAIWGRVKIKAKDLNDLGAITASDVPLIEGSIGTDDPSTWKDPTEGIMTARRLTIDGLNGQLHTFGWGADQRYDIPVPSTATPRESVDDAGLRAGIAQNVREMSAQDVIDQSDDGKTYPGDGPAGNEWLSAHGWDPKGNTLPPVVKRTIDRLAKSPHPKDSKEVENSAAVQNLRKLAEEGATPAIQAYAETALGDLLALHSHEEQPVQQGARDEAYAPPPEKKKKGGK